MTDLVHLEATLTAEQAYALEILLRTIKLSNWLTSQDSQEAVIALQAALDVAIDFM